LKQSLIEVGIQGWGLGWYGGWYEVIRLAVRTITQIIMAILSIAFNIIISFLVLGNARRLNDNNNNNYFITPDLLKDIFEGIVCSKKYFQQTVLLPNHLIYSIDTIDIRLV
jgi:uncharacterized membrane protein